MVCSCSRRDFLARGMYGIGLGAGLPLFLSRTSAALTARTPGLLDSPSPSVQSGRQGQRFELCQWRAERGCEQIGNSQPSAIGERP